VSPRGAGSSLWRDPDGTLDPGYGGGDGEVATNITNSDYPDGDIRPRLLQPRRRRGYRLAGGSGTFAGCLRSLTGGTAVWPVDPDFTCTESDTDPWSAIPATLGAAGRIATTASSGSATARLRFGVRMPAAQRPGRYIAPVTLEVIAPAV